MKSLLSIPAKYHWSHNFLHQHACLNACRQPSFCRKNFQHVHDCFPHASCRGFCVFPFWCIRLNLHIMGGGNNGGLFIVMCTVSYLSISVENVWELQKSEVSGAFKMDTIHFTFQSNYFAFILCSALLSWCRRGNFKIITSIHNIWWLLYFPSTACPQYCRLLLLRIHMTYLIINHLIQLTSSKCKYNCHPLPHFHGCTKCMTTIMPRTLQNVGQILHDFWWGRVRKNQTSTLRCYSLLILTLCQIVIIANKMEAAEYR